MQDNPSLSSQIVNRHLSRLEHHFGHNPEALAYAGIRELLTRIEV